MKGRCEMGWKISDAISDIKRRLHLLQSEPSWIGPSDSVWNGEYLLEESSAIFEAAEHLLRRAKEENEQLGVQTEIAKLIHEVYEFNESIVIPRAYFDIPNVTRCSIDKTDWLALTEELNIKGLVVIR